MQYDKSFLIVFRSFSYLVFLYKNFSKKVGYNEINYKIKFSYKFYIKKNNIQYVKLVIIFGLISIIS